VSADTSQRILLLLHDGELADVRGVAESLGARVVECAPADAPPDWDVLIASARHARDTYLRSTRLRAVRVAVLDSNSRTLRNLVRRAGVDLIVRRPVHPTALRLLLLHALYRGPERRSRRVAVGAPVRFRTGLRRRDGVLADLSMRGCMILSPRPVRVGQGIVVWVPDATNEARSFAVRGAVVRRLTGASGERGFGVDFGVVSKQLVAALKASVAAYLEGPAAHAGFDAGTTQPIPSVAALVQAPIAAESPSAPEPADERRERERRTYEGRRVVALGEEAARVLIGRDLSTGGMRVDPTPHLAVGQQLQIAIHAGPGQTPLVVPAEVVRDDGPRGFGLRFVALDEAAERYLAKMVDSLPDPDATGSAAVSGDDGDGEVVISQIVEPSAH
jgi:hypothetical protein